MEVKFAIFIVLLHVFLLNSCKENYSDPPDYTPPLIDIEADSMTFAVIGDFGLSGSMEEQVATMVKNWDPEFIITTGDNNYGSGDGESFRQNIGQYYCDFIYNPTAPAGQVCEGLAADEKLNRFFPSIGNNDYYLNKQFQPYSDYFSLPENEEYYEFKWGPVHFFSLNSASSANSQCCESDQAKWLIPKLEASGKRFKIVYFHHPPYSEASHGNSPSMQWDFPELGATTILSGHDHVFSVIYRTEYPDVPYIICGTGGYPQLYDCGDSTLDPLDFDVYCYDEFHGALKVTAYPQRIIFRYFAINDPSNPVYEIVID